MRKVTYAAAVRELTQVVHSGREFSFLGLGRKLGQCVCLPGPLLY